MKKILALAMVLSVLGSIVAGCGKTDDSAAATPAATTGTAAATTGAAADKTTGE